ncbi:hypothetical protein DGG96_09025 [Legionella qingyii]|uniref:Uncharacterized protein n=1 Tax=Legionella qingyii TaxID=2184757 RepID=A0A317U472_9GAMM|nr:hypothetical protein [Legionella qingyii]PWY56068.1 hypothetical protein DGG96_09025 [Legionella qingyii]RUR22070.1 hypothetical protein ELY20_10945 [Legionella qingyii]RUR25650.1 hypothetical protein ELY16_09755 [Legionella qingyii]
MQDKSELCNKLYTLAQIKTSNVSAECKSVLFEMQRLGLTIDSTLEKIKIFLGGIVLSMAQDQWKYGIKLSVNPGQIVENVKLPNQASCEEMIKQIGEYIGNNPYLISIDFFKQKIQARSGRSEVYFFPNLQNSMDEINGLLAEIKLALISEEDKSKALLLICVKNQIAFFASSKDNQGQVEDQTEEKYPEIN